MNSFSPDLRFEFLTLMFFSVTCACAIAETFNQIKILFSAPEQACEKEATAGSVKVASTFALRNAKAKRVQVASDQIESRTLQQSHK